MKPFVNDRGLIKYPYSRCVNNDRHQLAVLESHIFRYGFMAGYDVWIYHGENANATASSNVPEQNVEIPKRDEMFDVLDDIISEDVEVDSIGTQSSNLQYNE